MVWPSYAAHGGFRLAVSHWPSAHIWILGSRVVESSFHICFHSLLTSSLADNQEAKVFKKVAYPIKRGIVMF